MSSAASKSARPRSRTFTGCLTCRARKVKCDLGRPECANCRRLHHSCPGYAGVLSWLPTWAPSGKDAPERADCSGGRTACLKQERRQRARVEFLSEHNRQMESEKLLQHLTQRPDSSDINLLLDSLEQQTEELPAGSSPFQVEVGPYTVFSSGGSSVGVGSPPASLASPVDASLYDTLPDSAFIEDPPTLLCYSGADVHADHIVTEPAFESSSHDSALLHQMTSDAAGGISFEPGMPSASYLGATTDANMNRTSQGMPVPWSEQCSPFSPTPQISWLSSGSPYLPPNVRFLLHHYDNQVIDSLSAMPLPHDKAPWRDLHLPSAVRAYGELDIFGTSSLARVSLLYSLLSLTCYHISALYASSDLPHGGVAYQHNANVEDWKKQAEKFRGIGRTAFRKHVSSAPQNSHKDKYKESLMAAMSLVCVGIIGGDPWDARVYIRQCEMLIRAAVKSKHAFSERVLQLHRIFAFIRIMEQSTFCQSPGDYIRFLENKDVLPSEVRLLQETDEPDAGPDEVVDWCSPSSSPSAQPVYVDVESRWLPLGRPADDDDFNLLYCASGQLFRMLTRTNALISKMAEHNSDSDGSTDSAAKHPPHGPPRRGSTLSLSQKVLPDDLVAEANSLEQIICALADEFEEKDAILDTALRPDDPVVYEGGTDTESTMGQCMRNAFYNALLVYFFREVRNANPQILQHYVKKVIVCLERHQAIKNKAYPCQRIGTIVWPGFIVACEALSAELRSRAMACMRYSAAAGFRNGESAESVIHEVWKRRNRGHVPVSWRDVARQLNVFMLLS